MSQPEAPSEAGGGRAAGGPPGVRPPIFTRPFLAAAFASLLFFLSLNGFNLLPLYVKYLGGTEAQIGFIMGMNSLSSILFQPSTIFAEPSNPGEGG